MKKNNLLVISIITLSTLYSLSSCNSNTKKESENKEVKTHEESNGAQRLAYIEIDTLMSQYNFCKDYTLLMNKKGENIRATLAAKERALQIKAAEMQKKYESNQFTTRDQLEAAQMELNKQQQDLQALNERLMNDFANEQAKYNKEMRDSIQSFLKEYNKDKKYDLIISRAGDNILIANDKYDITKEVVEGLNKRYKTKAEIAKKISGE